MRIFHLFVRRLQNNAWPGVCQEPSQQRPARQAWRSARVVQGAELFADASPQAAVAAVSFNGRDKATTKMALQAGSFLARFGSAKCERYVRH